MVRIRRLATHRRRPRLALGAVGLVSIAAVAGACIGRSPAATTATGPVALRLGFLPNITQATALVGVHEGLLADALGPGVALKPKTFGAGPAAVEAIFAGGLDAAYLGPSPALTAFVRSHGRAVRIVAGAASGGAALVVRADIRSAADLKGRRVASPQLGGSQDVALRSWLADHGLRTNIYGGGDVSVVPQDNAQTLETLRSGAIAGAWVPEPWATRLVLDGGGKVLVDEATLWPGGRYATTQLVVATSFLDHHPDIVRRLLQGHVAATAFVNAEPERARAAANAEIEVATGKKLSAAVLAASWRHLTFTNDPIAASVRAAATRAVALELLGDGAVKGSGIDAIYDLRLLDEVLRAAGQPPVDPG